MNETKWNDLSKQADVEVMETCYKGKVFLCLAAVMKEVEALLFKRSRVVSTVLGIWCY